MSPSSNESGRADPPAPGSEQLLLNRVRRGSSSAVGALSGARTTRKEVAMAKTQTRPWDATDYLETEEDIVAYLEAAFDDGDPRLIAAALGDVARAKGMTKIATEAGLGRESLYKALSADGNPEFATVLKVMRALGLRLHASAVAVQ